MVGHPSKPIHIADSLSTFHGRTSPTVLQEKTEGESLEEVMSKRKDISEAIYVSPNQLAARWACSRSSVDRAAQKAGFSRFFLGSGKNGNIRYLLSEVLEFERKQTV